SEQIALLDAMNLLQPAAMPRLAGKTSVEKEDAQVLGQLRPNHAGAQHEHVQVVVLNALVGGVSVMAKAGADAGNLVGGDRGADAAAADQDAALRFALQHAQRDSLSVVRIIHRPGAVRADVDEFVAELAQVGYQQGLQFEAGMVRADGDLHGSLRAKAQISA